MGQPRPGSPVGEGREGRGRSPALGSQTRRAGWAWNSVGKGEGYLLWLLTGRGSKERGSARRGMGGGGRGTLDVGSGGADTPT
jgi:hypothetical protein